MTCQLHLAQDFFAANSSSNMGENFNLSILNSNYTQDYWRAVVGSLLKKYSHTPQKAIEQIVALENKKNFTQTDFLERYTGNLLAQQKFSDSELLSGGKVSLHTNRWQNRIINYALAKRGSNLLTERQIISTPKITKLYCAKLPVQERATKTFQLLKAALITPQEIFDFAYNSDPKSYDGGKGILERGEVITFLLSQMKDNLLPTDIEPVSWLWSCYFRGSYIYVAEGEEIPSTEQLISINQKMTAEISKDAYNILNYTFQKTKGNFDYRAYGSFLAWLELCQQVNPIEPLWRHNFILRVAEQLGIVVTDSPEFPQVFLDTYWGMKSPANKFKNYMRNKKIFKFF